MIVKRDDDIITIVMSSHTARLMASVYGVALAAVESHGASAELINKMQHTYHTIKDAVN